MLEQGDSSDSTESEQGFDDDERRLLKDVARKKRRQHKEEEEVLRMSTSSEVSEDQMSNSSDGEETADNEPDEEPSSTEDSDIEDRAEDDGLPDSKAWGSDKKKYYNTDYVDQDYLGFDNEEAANEEEREADVIQRRLMSHLEGTDFTLGLLDSVEDKKKEAAKKHDVPEHLEDEEKVAVDLSSLTAEELVQLIKRKVPEMSPILQECNDRVSYLRDKVAPVLELVDSGVIEKSKGTDYLRILHTLTIHYTINSLFYLYLIEKGVRTSDHTVMKRLKSLKHLLFEMDELKEQVDPQLDMLLEKITDGEEIGKVKKDESNQVVPPPANRKERRKRKLELLKKKEEHAALVEKKKQKLMSVGEMNFEEELEMKAKKEDKPVENVLYSEEDEVSDGDDNEDKEKEVDKRAVTFEMLKNKGLTPRRKKENRNPRVKHRNKFKKAVSRRKGQVRAPRKELNKYGGEISGININVRKSIKIK